MRERGKKRRRKNDIKGEKGGSGKKGQKKDKEWKRE